MLEGEGEEGEEQFARGWERKIPRGSQVTRSQLLPTVEWS